MAPLPLLGYSRGMGRIRTPLRAGAAVLVAVAAGLAPSVAGCRRWRISGEPPEAIGQKPPHEPAYEVSAATAPRRRPQPVLRDLSQEELASVRYFSDLGPDEIDVSSYPAPQRANYALFRYACSQCHTLARAVNSPVVSRRFWELYVLGMRFRAHFDGERRIAKEDVDAIVEFLDFDSQERKFGRRSEFDAEQDALRKRYDRLIEERMERLQKGEQPTLIPRR